MTNDQMMMVMTATARRRVAELLSHNPKRPLGLRITRRGGRHSPSHDFTIVEATEEGDLHVEVEGVSIWFEPAETVNLFRVEIDHEGAGGEEGFVIKERYATC